MLTGTPFGFSNGDDKVCGWGVKIPADRGVTDEPVRVVRQSGYVMIERLGKRVTQFVDNKTGELVEAWSVRNQN